MSQDDYAAHNENHWRVHTAEEDFTLSGAKLVAPRIELGNVITVGSDLFVLELTSMLHLIDKYQSLAAALVPLVLKTRAAYLYRVETCANHSLAVSQKIYDEFKQRVANAKMLFYRGTYLAVLFQVLWRYVSNAKDTNLLTNLNYIIRGDKVMSDEEMFREFKLRDANGAGYGLAKIKTIRDLDIAKAKGRPIFVDLLMAALAASRDVLGYAAVTNLSPEEKQLQLALWKQSCLFVRLFVETLLELKFPEKIVDSLKTRDELVAVTDDIVSRIGTTQKSTGYSSTSSTYTSEGVPFTPETVDVVNKYIDQPGDAPGGSYSMGDFLGDPSQPQKPRY